MSTIEKATIVEPPSDKLIECPPQERKMLRLRSPITPPEIIHQEIRRQPEDDDTRHLTTTESVRVGFPTGVRGGKGRRGIFKLQPRFLFYIELERDVARGAFSSRGYRAVCCQAASSLRFCDRAEIRQNHGARSRAARDRRGRAATNVTLHVPPQTALPSALSIAI